MASRNNSEEINFQPYIDTVKNGEIPWNIFVKTMEDLSYTDINRLKCLNAVLLMELSMSHSDMDRLKYLNKTCPKGFGLKLANLGLKTPLKSQAETS